MAGFGAFRSCVLLGKATLDAALAQSIFTMLGTGFASDAPTRIAECMDGIKEVVVTCSRKQQEQRQQLDELRKASDVQDEKLMALRKQLMKLKARAKRSLGRRAKQNLANATALAASDNRQLRGAATSTSASNSPMPTVHEESHPLLDQSHSDEAKTKMVYGNGKISFAREVLLRSLDLPADTIDYRMEPFLEELAAELGRPRRKPAPVPACHRSIQQRQNVPGNLRRWPSKWSDEVNDDKSRKTDSYGTWKPNNWKDNTHSAWKW